MKKYLKGYYRDFVSMKWYLALSTLLFTIGIMIGAESEMFHHFLDQQLKGLGEVAGELSDKQHANVWFFLFIFFNNTLKSIFVMYLGGLLGFIPIIFLAVNGMIIGYLFVQMSEAGQNVWMLLIKGILPHGIIEIPAIIIACAFGLRFGAIVWVMFINLFRSKETRTQHMAAAETFLYRTLHMMIFLVVTLFIAALIESTFTFWLMNQ